MRERHHLRHYSKSSCPRKHQSASGFPGIGTVRKAQANCDQCESAICRTNEYIAWELGTHCCYYPRSAGGLLQGNRSVSFQHQRQPCACRVGQTAQNIFKTEAATDQRSSPSAGPTLPSKIFGIGPGPEIITVPLHVRGRKNILRVVIFLLPSLVGPALLVEGFRHLANPNPLTQSNYAWGWRATLGSAVAAIGGPRAANELPSKWIC